MCWEDCVMDWQMTGNNINNKTYLFRMAQLSIQHTLKYALAVCLVGSSYTISKI